MVDSISTIVGNSTGGFVDLVCALDAGVDHWYIITMLSLIGLITLFGVYAWKKDLFISVASSSIVLAFVSLGFRLMECSNNGHIFVSTKIVITFFIIAALAAAVVKGTTRGD